MPELWTPPQAAQFLQISQDQLSDLRQRGDGPPFVKVGRFIRYVPGAVATWCTERTQTSTKGQP